MNKAIMIITKVLAVTIYITGLAFVYVPYSGLQALVSNAPGPSLAAIGAYTLLAVLFTIVGAYIYLRVSTPRTK